MRVKTLALAAGATGVAIVYRRFLRGPILTWVATAEEAATRTFVLEGIKWRAERLATQEHESAQPSAHGLH